MNDRDISIFGKLLIANAIFINSCLSRVPHNHPRFKLFRFLLHLIYIFIPSCLFGFTLYFVLAIFFTMLNSEITIGGATIYSMILFIFSILFSVISLNYHNTQFNLPRELFILVSLIKKSKFISRVFKSVSFVILISLLFLFLWMIPLSQFSISTTGIKLIISIIFLINFLLAFAIYSYSTVNEDERTFRQLVLWTVVLVVMFVFTAIQITLYLGSPINSLNLSGFILSVIGLLFSLTSVIDKAIQWLKSEFKHNEKQILEQMELLSYELITITKVTQMMRKQKQDFVEIGIKQRELWKTGHKLNVVNAYLLLMIMAIGMFLFHKILIDGKVEEAFYLLTEYTKRSIGISSESLRHTAAIAMVVGISIWLIFHLLIRFNTRPFLEKLERIAMLIATITFLIIMLSSIVPFFKVLTYPVMIVTGWLIGGIGLFIMLIKFISWLYKKIQHL
ncbi:hypothetical protein [Paenibacillus protaetiae]|uniref:Uncharacterized protein n=1 Tax=Paenibacillus protaetiae TaxID=2509456 RepID=A0A4P6ET84_9BACL|nr:hypothetical protein [Paenibacillus protaetiae]QAY66370.1 hypothetical protein ET464_08065 [Paenibacillus protaetiae]